MQDLIRWTTSCNSGECNDADKLDINLCKCRHPELERLHPEDRADCMDVDIDSFTPTCDFPHRTIGETLQFFARMALAAPALGIAFGIAASSWINFVYNDLVVEVAITFVTAYLTYYTADDILKMSGVLATVALGITMGLMAKPRLSPKTHEPIEVFWEMLEYMANTTIFLYAGVKIAIKIWEVGIEVSSLFWAQSTPSLCSVRTKLCGLGHCEPLGFVQLGSGRSGWAKRVIAHLLWN